MKVKFENQSHLSKKQRELLMRNIEDITECASYPEVVFSHVGRNQWSYKFIDDYSGFDRTVQFGCITIGKSKTHY